jgi:hypothetical protein
MTKQQPDAAERPDDDNPPLTRAELRRTRPAAEVVPGLVGEVAAIALLRPHRGRPTKCCVRSFPTVSVGFMESVHYPPATTP